MQLIQYAAPTLTPVTLAELKTHLRLDRDTFAGNIESSQSIAPGSHGIAAAYSLVGTGVDVAGKQAVVYLQSGTNGATGTVDVKIQEYNGTTWADWTGGALTQVTTANDNATYEKAYTGHCAQIRTVATVALAACEFGTSVVVNSAVTSEDDDLTDLILDAVAQVETITRRALLTQTWDYYLPCFPGKNYIPVPFGNLQSVTSMTYTDTDGTVTTMAAGTDYLVEINGDQHGNIILPYGESWPPDVLYPSNPIAIRFVCGWAAAASVPKNLKRSVKFACENLYYRGGRDESLKRAIDSLCATWRLWGEF